MDRFEALWRAAVEASAEALAHRHVAAADVAATQRSLEQLHFPGRLAILSGGGGDGPVGHDLIGAAASLAATQPAFARAGIDGATVAAALRAILVERRSPGDLLQDEALQSAALEAAARVLAARGVSITPDEARTALRLLTTGEFFDDVAATTATVVHFVPRLPLAIGRDIPQLPLHLVRLLPAVLADAPELAVASARLLVSSMLDGAPTTTPKVMTRTMRALYAMASLRTTAETLRTLVGRDNESFRLAIILYARANGVPLDEAQLDALHDRVLATDDPDLGPALAAALERFMDQSGPSGLRTVLDALATRAPGAGDTRAFAIPVQEPPTRFEGVVFRMRAETTDAPAGVVARQLGAGWHTQPFAASSPRDFEAIPAQAMAPGDGWEAVYTLAKDPAVERAEPRFETHAPDAADATVTTRALRSVFGGDDDDPAADEPTWSPRLVRAFDAWSLEPPPGGARFGEGVLVGHPDTGYTRHAQLGDRIVGGYDFLDDDADATDPLDGHAWLLQFPGHGTGTASVLVSADEPGGAMRVTGVAPGAHVYPLRVSRSVIHLSMGNVTKAIYYAVDHGCHVISMSLGGPLGFGYLHDAVRYAVERGVIVVAAAGNYVGFVTYPAAYDEVIAVAGCTVSRRPWSGSSRGPDVDVGAPAARVWKALAQDGDPVPFTAVEQGDGTSFATATVAGIAALWLAHHGRDRLVVRYGAARIPEVFRAMLQATCQPGVDWDTGRFGAGVVDARAVLAQPLPAAPPAPRTLRRRAFAPEAASRLPADVVADEVQRQFPDATRTDVLDALRTLLQSDDRHVERRLDEVGPELVMHLATDRELRTSFASLLERRTRAFDAPRATPTTDPHARLARVASPRLRGR